MNHQFLLNIKYKFSETLIYEIDLNHIVTYVNKDFCETVGYREHELIGKNNIFYKHPDVPKKRYQILWDIKYYDNKKMYFTLKNLRRDGLYFWSNIFISAKLSKSKKIQGHIVIHKPASDLDVIEEQSIYDHYKSKSNI